MLLGLRTTVYIVSDLAAAKAWYAEAFGLTPSFDQDYYVGFTVGGFELGLVPQATPFAPGPGGTLAYWGVADVPAAYAHLLAHGAQPVEEPTDVGEGIVTAAVVDPWGNLVALMDNPHFDPSAVG